MHALWYRIIYNYCSNISLTVGLKITTWDGSEGTSVNWNRESTTASNIFPEVFFMVFETSTFLGINCCNSLMKKGCIYIYMYVCNRTHINGSDQSSYITAEIDDIYVKCITWTVEESEVLRWSKLWEMRRFGNEPLTCKALYEEIAIVNYLLISDYLLSLLYHAAYIQAGTTHIMIMMAADPSSPCNSIPSLDCDGFLYIIHKHCNL